MSARSRLARWLEATLLAGLCACGSQDPAPAPIPAAPAQPEPPEPPKPEPPKPEPPKPKPEPPEPEVLAAIARCKIVVDGRGPKIVRAVVNADSGPRKGDVEEGNKVGYDCPDEADRRNVDLIVALDNGKAAHWKNLEVQPDQEAHVKNSASESGYPEGYTPEQLEMLERDLGISAEDAAVAPQEAAPDKSPVTFQPFELPWAELTLVAKGKRPQKITLAGKRSLMLAPGTYEVSFLDEPDGESQKAGMLLKIETGQSYSVKMLKRPPHMSVKVQ